MKKRFFMIISMCILISFTACSGEVIESDSTVPTDEVIGNDWHVWGLYEFEKVDDIKIAIDQVNNDEGEHIGFDIYQDGDELGALLCQIRAEDGGYELADMDKNTSLLFEDYNNDGLTDIGAPLKNGDAMWYIQNENKEFSYFETQLKSKD